MASLTIETVEAALRQLEAKLPEQMGMEEWWTELMSSYYPYPFQREGTGREQYWRDLPIERLLNVQGILLRDINALKGGSRLGRNLHGVSREILRRQIEAFHSRELTAADFGQF